MVARRKEIRPQEGFQQDFLSTSADIAIGGGAAGAGKTFALLLEPTRHSRNADFGSVIFRRTSPQIRSEGGLWDTSESLYPNVGARPIESKLTWKFPRGASMKFSHLEYEKNVLDWQGSQVPLIGFDELTHFTEKMFFYMLSRNRSTCGVKPYIRATCNPDPDSWVANFIEWWICQDDKSPHYGFPIAERAGKLRYFIKDGDSMVWGNSKDEVLAKVPHVIEVMKTANEDTNPYNLVKSATFIPGDIYGNKALLSKDPGYLANLMAQDEATRLQLLDGNWKVKIDEAELINFTKLKDAFTNDFVKGTEKYITADIALKGSDLLVIAYWEGFRWLDIKVMEKSKGNEVIDAIKEMANKWRVPQSHILYDDDGVGQFVDGFIQNSIPFKNGAAPLEEIVNNQKIKPNYKYLRDQLYFKMADRINRDGYY
ncbi:terminase large subunit domain-containing protein, partial [Mariniphaga sediminis]|uniref:terminase large subunit domain-containing protein n=1 Tax=Mariniphaga sediminis TaxID=1628158 RepID=UPI0035632CCA